MIRTEQTNFSLTMKTTGMEETIAFKQTLKTT